MRKIRAKRFFISAQFGNVDTGRILEVSDSQAQQFIQHGLAEAVAPVPRPPAPENKGNFSDPAKEKEPSGSSSQADQASQSGTAKKSGGGAKRPRRKRAKKKTAKSQS